MQNYENMIMESNILESAELFAAGIIANEFSDRLVYHDISHQFRIIEAIQSIGLSEHLPDEQMEYLLLAGWLVHLGFRNLDQFPRLRTTDDLFENCSKHSIRIAYDFLEDHNYPEDKKTRLLDLLNQMSPHFRGKLTANAMILRDAMAIDHAGPKGNKRLRKLYEELLLTHVETISKSDYYDLSIKYLTRHKYHTDYALKEWRPRKEVLIAKLLKKQRIVKKNEKNAIRETLGIEEKEMKRLQRNLRLVEGRDDRGIQTMFRTTSRNHYTLSEMVDRKARIMISVNAVILSVIIGSFIANDLFLSVHNLPIIVVLLSASTSIFFAVRAIRPEKTHGSFTEAEIRSKQGNLLYFGNYHNMSLKDYD